MRGQFDTKRSSLRTGSVIALAFLMYLTGVAAGAAERSVFVSTMSTQDVPLTEDPAAEFWKSSVPVIANTTKNGEFAGLAMEVRSRWTPRYLYLLFVCPYEELNLKPFPDTTKETNELWNWDVAEVFIGSDFDDIKRYKEFEVSPQGEWVDLDINLDDPQHETGWVWNSGFEHTARIGRSERVWYAAMKIPFAAIGRSGVAGATFRVNLFLSQGPPTRYKAVCWQPTMSATFHVPERFGRLRLVHDSSTKRSNPKR